MVVVERDSLEKVLWYLEETNLWSMKLTSGVGKLLDTRTVNGLFLQATTYSLSPPYPSWLVVTAALASSMAIFLLSREGAEVGRRVGNRPRLESASRERADVGKQV